MNCAILRYQIILTRMLRCLSWALLCGGLFVALGGCGEDEPSLKDDFNPSQEEERDRYKDPKEDLTEEEEEVDPSEEGPEIWGPGSPSGPAGPPPSDGSHESQQCSATQEEYYSCFGRCMSEETDQGALQKCQEKCQLCSEKEPERITPFNRVKPWGDHPCVKAAASNRLCVSHALSLKPRRGNYHDISSYFKNRLTQQPNYFLARVHLRSDFLRLYVRSARTSEAGKRFGFDFRGPVKFAMSSVPSSVGLSAQTSGQKYDLYVTVQQRSGHRCAVELAFLTPITHSVLAYYIGSAECRG